MRLYHLVRRAGIFRVRNKWAPQKAGYDGHTAVLDRGHEMCYTFGSGLCSIEHARNMFDYLMRMGVKNPDALLTRPDVREYLAQSYQYLLTLPIDAPEIANSPQEQEKILHDWILFQNPKLRQILNDALPENLKNMAENEVNLVRFFNYLVGIDLSRKYAGLTSALGFFDPTVALKPLNDRSVHDRSLWPVYANLARKRAAVLFVYDTSIQTLAEFQNKTYQGAYYRLLPGHAPERKEAW